MRCKGWPTSQSMQHDFVLRDRHSAVPFTLDCVLGRVQFNSVFDALCWSRTVEVLARSRPTQFQSSPLSLLRVSLSNSWGCVRRL